MIAHKLACVDIAYYIQSSKTDWKDRITASQNVNSRRGSGTGFSNRGGLSTEVAAHVRERILIGELRPGTKVDQEAISIALGVSRSPVREAVILLGTEGLLELLPRRGAIVAELSRDDVIDHYELYGLVSGRAAAAAALTLDRRSRAELQEVHDRFVSASGSDLSEANRDFHRLINRAAPSRTRWLLKLLEKSVPSRYYEFATGWEVQALEHHQEILERIVARDADGARAAMEHHLHCSGVAAADVLEARGFWADDREL